MIRLYDAQKKEKLAVINQTLSRWDVFRCYSSVASRNREPLERDYALLLNYRLGGIRLGDQSLNMVCTFIKATITRSGLHNDKSCA